MPWSSPSPQEPPIPAERRAPAPKTTGTWPARAGKGKRPRDLPFLAAVLLLCSIQLLLSPQGSQAAERYARERQAMIQTIERSHKQMPAEVGVGIDPEVLRAMEAVPRHAFVPEEHKDRAYANRPLPIGYGQTISQPYIVALMTDLLEVEAGDTVFELGTGSGYQAAVLSHLSSQVLSMEIIPELAKEAEARLQNLGFDNVRVLQGDAYYGLKEAAPFEAIVVTAAASHIPPPLIRQLKPGGRMVIPVGQPFLTQQLTLVLKDDQGSIRTKHLLPVSFVPLTGQH